MQEGICRGNRSETEQVGAKQAGISWDSRVSGGLKVSREGDKFGKEAEGDSLWHTFLVFSETTKHLLFFLQKPLPPKTRKELDLCSGFIWIFLVLFFLSSHPYNFLFCSSFPLPPKNPVEFRSIFLCPAVEVCSVVFLEMRKIWSALWHQREIIQSFSLVTPFHKRPGAVNSDNSNAWVSQIGWEERSHQCLM